MWVGVWMLSMWSRKMEFVEEIRQEVLEEHKYIYIRRRTHCKKEHNTEREEEGEGKQDKKQISIKIRKEIAIQ